MRAATLAVGAAAGALISKGLERARASPSTRALSKPDAELAAALAAHESTKHLVAGWPAAGERDGQKAELLSAVRSKLASASAASSAASDNDKKESEGSEKKNELGEQEIEALRQSVLVAPTPEKRPKVLETAFSDDASAAPARRIDDYYWLRDDARKSKAVLSHLAAENAYVAASLADADGVKAEITKELRAAIQEADEGAPVRKAGYWWWWRTKEGGEYRQHVRRRVSKAALSRPPTERDAAELVKANAARAAGEASAGTTDEEEEEVFLDEDARAQGKSFYMTGGVTASPDGSALAWGEDTEGGEKFTLHCVDLRSGRPLLKKPIPSTAGNFVFSSPPKKDDEKSKDSGSGDEAAEAAATTTCTSTHLFYTTKDALDRPHKVWRHRLGSDAADDALVFHEEDDAFYVSVGRTRDGSLILVSSGSAITTEVRALRADEPESELAVLLPRVHDVEYDVGCHSAAGRLLVARRTAAAPNSELLAPALDLSRPLSEQAPLDLEAAPVLALHRPDVKLEDFVVSAAFVALFERVEGLQRATVFGLAPDPKGALSCGPLSGGKVVAFDDAAYELGAGAQGDFDSPILRLSYSSLASPPATVDLDATTAADVDRRATVRVAPVLGGFRSEDYAVERLWATAEQDGVRIPISLVYNKTMWDKEKDGPAPLLLNGYGSYESCNDPGFHQSKLPLLDRGVSFAIAHVRGGGELGRAWYEDGKFLKKPNTWKDFVSCARFLCERGYTSPEVLACEGRSAGGLLIGAALNDAPELFAAAVAGVPFVDCLTTMLDESIPLTTIEFDEWGNPAAEKTFYDAIGAYAPVDNVISGAKYPTILVTAGLHDPRVGYWEPAKWVARIRELGKPRGPVLFKCDLGAGHFSKSGRFDRLSEVALEHAFLLKSFGLLRAERKVKRSK